MQYVILFPKSFPEKTRQENFISVSDSCPVGRVDFFSHMFASRGLESYFCSYQLKTNLKNNSNVFSALRLANGTNLLATAQALPTQWLHRRGLFPVSWVELGLREFQNGGRFKHLPSNSAAERIGEKQGYLQKMM